MSQHMVIFQNPDGHPGYNQFESVEEAVAFVEKLRNEQSIDSIRIFELNELKFELKPYYKVQMQALNPGAPSRPAPAPAQAPAPAPAPTPAAAPAAAPAPTPAPAAPKPAAPPAGAPGQTTGSPFAPPSGAPEAKPEEPAGGPVPPADQPAQEEQPTRRGLFGR